MKKAFLLWIAGWWMTAGALVAQTSKIDQDRMDRDIKVAENVLQTLFQQQSNRSIFFFNDIEGSYVPGYGVIFAVPNSSWHFVTPMPPGAFMWSNGNGGFNFRLDSDTQVNGVITGPPDEDSTPDVDVEPDSDQTVHVMRVHRDMDRRSADMAKQQQEMARQQADMARMNYEMNKETYKMGKLKDKDLVSKEKSDSARTAAEGQLLDIMKTFLADYGDLLSQVPENESIMVTNRPSGFNRWESRGSDLVSAEVKKNDLTQFRQGKINRDQLMSRITTVNATSTSDEKPDLELFASMLNRLYQPDLSSTFFIDDDVYYEQLKNFGVIYYMNVYSANRDDRDNTYVMPTQKNAKVSDEERNKKVAELYPQFEKDLKDNMLEYGRTIKSLGDNDMLMIKVKLTRCDKCGIPSSLELSVKGSVLKDYNSGKVAENDAVTKITEKKGEAQ